MVAIALLTTGLLPLAYSLAAEHKTARCYYQRAVAMEIVDGEMEVLLAGNPRQLPAGTREYEVTAQARKNLPAGNFVLTVTNNLVRLEWKPALKDRGGPVVAVGMGPEQGAKRKLGICRALVQTGKQAGQFAGIVAGLIRPGSAVTIGFAFVFRTEGPRGKTQQRRSLLEKLSRVKVSGVRRLLQQTRAPERYQ